MKQRINTNRERFAMLYEDKANGIISNEEFTMLKDQYQKDSENCKIRIIKIDNEIINLRKEMKQRESETNIFEKYTHIDELDRTILDTFVFKIVVGKLNEETNKRDIRIIWNFSF